MKNIEIFLKKNIGDLNIENDKFHQLENELDIKISEEVKFFWTCCSSLTLGYSECYVSPLVDFDYYLDTIEDLIANSEELNEFAKAEEVAREVKPFAYNKKWVPFIEVDGLYNFFDFDPSEFGQNGQIILADMMGGEGEVSHASQSLDDLIGKLNKEIQSGRFIVSSESMDFVVVPADEDDEIFTAIGLWEEE